MAAEDLDGIDPAVYARRWKTLGRAVRIADHRHRRQHRAQRRAADAADAGGRRRHRGHRTPTSSGSSMPTASCSPGCCSRLPRSVTASVAREPCRRASCLRARIAARRVRRHLRLADRVARGDGRRRGIRHALDTVDPRQRLPGPGAGQGDRRLGRHLRRRRGDRPGRLRTAARALLVRLGVPRQPADHHRGDRRRVRARAEVEGCRRDAARPGRRRAVDPRPELRSSTRSSRDHTTAG